MVIDGRALPSGAELRAEVIVVGAGPAGITVALELSRVGHEVLLLESGGKRFSKSAQELGDTPHLDERVHAPMNLCTRRQIGGASVIWGGRCVPYDAVDFEPRPWIPHSGWPIRHEDVLPFYPRACEWLLCGTSEFDIDRIPGIAQKSIVPGLPDEEVLTSQVERWSLPTDFGKYYRVALARSERLRLIHHVSCVEIVPDAGGRGVASLRAKASSGQPVSLRARAYVVACGGVETARLLLASNSVIPGGIGNAGDKLGRYYMGHISGRVARVRFTTPPDRTVFAFDRDPDGVYLRRRFSFSRAAQVAHGLTNVAIWLVNPELRDPSHGSGILSFAYLALTSPWLGHLLAPEAIRKSAAGELRRRAVLPHVVNMIRDAPATLAFIPAFGWKRFVATRKVPGFFIPSASNTYVLHYHGEQVPNRASRVVLADEADRLGLRKIKIDLTYSPQDVDGVVRSHELLDRHLRRHGVGALQYLMNDVPAAVWDQAADGYHQVGTTRMSASPREGVVDPNCAVHGFRDLFVAGSSVFPTSGQANSTFMIVVLALRLSDHLKSVVLKS